MFPHRYLAMMGAHPTCARDLKVVKPEKKKNYLAVADALLRKQATEANRRSIEFLIELCTSTDPGNIPALAWLQEEPSRPAIMIGLPSTLGRVAPLMKFRSTLRR